MELEVLAIFVVLELAEHLELLQGGIEEGSVDLGCVVTYVLEARCLHPYLADLLEQHLEQLCDQTPTGCQ